MLESSKKPIRTLFRDFIAQKTYIGDDVEVYILLNQQKDVKQLIIRALNPNNHKEVHCSLDLTDQVPSLKYTNLLVEKFGTNNTKYRTQYEILGQDFAWLQKIKKSGQKIIITPETKSDKEIKNLNPIKEEVKPEAPKAETPKPEKPKVEPKKDTKTSEKPNE